VNVHLETALQVRSGLLDIAFDPSRLKFLRAELGSMVKDSKRASLRASAPDGLGRLSLSLASPADISGTGELARITFQSVPGMAGSPSMRLEAASLTDTTGKILASQLPPPISVSLAR
jgi:hypothetical protein